MNEGPIAGEWTPSLVLTDVREHTLLDLVPLDRAGRKVGGVNDHVESVGEVLDRDPSPAGSRTVAPSGVCNDDKLIGFGDMGAPMCCHRR